MHLQSRGPVIWRRELVVVNIGTETESLSDSLLIPGVQVDCEEPDEQPERCLRSIRDQPAVSPRPRRKGSAAGARCGCRRGAGGAAGGPGTQAAALATGCS